MLSSILRQARSLKRLITTTLKNTMAKISTYPTDSNITTSDMLIGTDGDSNNATKNYTVGGLQSFFGQTFVPYTGANNNVDLGLNSLTAAYGIFNFGVELYGALALGITNNAGNTGDLLVSQGPGVVPSWTPSSAFLQPAAASFYDTTVQSAAAVTPTAMKFGTNDIISTSITIANDGGGNKTRITINDTGVFNIQFSAQLQKTAGGGPDKVSIWLRKNGVNVANSTTHVTMTNNNDYNVASWNFFVDATSGNYFNIMWATNSGATVITTEGVDPIHPAVPSVILTVNKVK